jgi:hypothetical protein
MPPEPPDKEEPGPRPETEEKQALRESEEAAKSAKHPWWKFWAKR